MSNLLAAVALVVSLAVAFFQWRQGNRHNAEQNAIQERLAAVEEDRRSAERDQEARQQAQQVSCWVTFVRREAVPRDSVLITAHPDPGVFVKYQNLSDEPVHNVRTYVSPDWTRSATAPESRSA